MVQTETDTPASGGPTPALVSGRFSLAGCGLALLLAAATLLAYIPAIQSGFIWDDDFYVTDNPFVQAPSGWAKVWIPGNTVQYYPMVFTTFWIEHKLWEFNPAGYHVTNVLLHIAGALLLGSLLRYLKVPGAWLAAAIFALHPVHVESVAWITERKNVLSGFFYLAAASAFLRFEDRGRYAWYALALLCFLLALLSKSVTCSLPAALILIRWFRGKPISLRYVAGLIPFFAIGIALGLHTAWYEVHHVHAAGTGWDFSIGQRLLIAGRALWFYPTKLTWPAHLTFIYPRWKLDTADFAQWLYPAGVVIVALAVWIPRGRWGRGPAVALALMAGTLFPALGFFNVYPFRFSFVADHFQYLASAGWIALVSAVLVGALGRIVRRTRVRFIAAGSLGGGLLVALAALTFQQTRLYKNPETLWRETLRRNPDAWMAHINLGLELHNREKYAEALEHYRKAMALGLDDEGLANVHNLIGATLINVGREAEAQLHFLHAIKYRPHHWRAYFNLAAVFEMQGDADRAIQYLRKALEIYPSSLKVKIALAPLLAERGEHDEVISILYDVLDMQPDNPHVHSTLARAFAEKGRFSDALRHAFRAVELKPNNRTFRMTLGTALASNGRFEEAIDQFREALRLGPQDHEARIALADLLLHAGRYRQAVQTLRQGLESTPAHLLMMQRLAWLLATAPQENLRRPADALRLAQQLTRNTLNPGPEDLNTLAAAYAANGQFDRACKAARQALERLAERDNPVLADDIKQRLEEYEQNKPVYQPKPFVRSRPKRPSAKKHKPAPSRPAAN